MRDNNTPAADISSLFDHYTYHNLIQSLLVRKQGRLYHSSKDNFAILSWGPSIFIGGEFSEASGEKLVSTLAARDTPRYLNYPNEQWRSFIKSTFSDRLKDMYLNLYESVNTSDINHNEYSPYIICVTHDFIKKCLPNTGTLTDELYSYTDMEDFYKNGFGLALLIDGAVSGYCLSEYSVSNSCGINIWIDEKYRGAGYAGKMVNAFLSHCQETNQTAYWACNADNIKSNRLAASCGFTLKSTMHYFEL